MQESLAHLKPKFIIIRYQELLDVIDKFIKEKRKELVITLNTEMFVDSMNDKEFNQIINQSVVFLESIGICHLFYKKTGTKVEPINGIDLAERLIEKGYRTFILGTKDDIVCKAVDNLRKKYRDANIVGFYHGYFEDEDKVIDYVNNLGVELLLVGMGSPKQEKWVYRNRERLNFGVAMGIGGSIDVWAGVVKRAPVFIRKIKMEWLYRLLTDFRRIKRAGKLLKFVMMNISGRFSNG